MVTIEQVRDYIKQKFDEQNVDDRIEDRGFAFYVNTQPREYLDTKDESKTARGNGPIVILKETGEIFSFPSSPIFMFGSSDKRVGVNTAETIEEFNEALKGLENKGYQYSDPERLDN